jgi:transcriptional regulator with XRE-family HTH domain
VSPSGPTRPIVRFCGVAYVMDTQAARRALVRRQVTGQFFTMQALAQAVGCSRATLSAWFSGRHATTRTTVAILDKLQLTFEEVYRPVGEDGSLAELGVRDEPGEGTAWLAGGTRAGDASVAPTS